LEVLVAAGVPMAANPRWRGRATGLTDRHAERDALDRLIEAVRGGESRALVVRGDPGVGKTVLLDHLAGRASGAGCRVARATGVQSEMEQLRTAHGMLAAIGMEAFAERARRELTATGEKVRRRRAETRDQLTPQEEQIARLARDGRTNSEIGAQLFLSARTVEWHLRKIFTKLGIGSRHELKAALAEGGQAVSRLS
jgi:DNA-binding CsgD family transcriptional regulator